MSSPQPPDWITPRRAPSLAPATSRGLNVTAILAVVVFVMLAAVDQFASGEPQCVLCTLLRIALLGVAISFALNLRFGPHASHYAMAMLSAVVAGLIAAQQLLKHLVPGAKPPEFTLFGFNVHSLTLILACMVVAGCTFLVVFDQRSAIGRRGRRRLSPLGFTALFIIGVLALVNGLASLLECSIATCPGDPLSGIVREILPPGSIPALPGWLERLSFAAAQLVDRPS